MKNTDGKPVPDMELARGEFGLWQQGVHIGGELVGEPQPDEREVIAKLIGEYYERGQFVSTSSAANAPTGVHASLKGDPRWPRKLRKAKQTNEVLRDMERDGIIAKGPVPAPRTERGPSGGRWMP